MTTSTAEIQPARDDAPPEVSTPFQATEHDPLLGSSSGSQNLAPSKKPWYRPRPLWLVPFYVTASLCRGMTLAPRTEVFIQLACEQFQTGRHHHTSDHHHTDSFSILSTNFSTSPDRFQLYTEINESASLIVDRTPVVQLPPLEERRSKNDSQEDDDLPTVGDPPIDCLADITVQAGAAKLQTIMTTTMGVLSALTTGWWGQFGDRHGRTRVISLALFGLLFTDIMFILASNPPEILRGHAHLLLFIAPVVEGLVGGQSTMQSATHAYVSDCTSHGSRAHIYSRFTGVFFIGIALGPEIAAVVLRQTHATTLVFYISAICAFTNMILMLFVFPESLSMELRRENIKATREARDQALREAQGKGGLWRSTKTAVKGFIKPLGVLGPKPREHGRGLDWSLTLLSMAMFGHYLSIGVFQIRYLYAKHVYGWDAETLSYYITAVGSARALHLLLLLPTVIRLFKPKPRSNRPAANEQPAPVLQSQKKAAPTQKALLTEIKFDLVVAKFSLVLDLFSQVLVVLAPSSSVGLFVVFSGMSSFGTGMIPTCQSVAMCTLHLREGGDGETPATKGGADVGRLFGAFAVLQAVGSMILGPLIFGAIYSATVGPYPKAIYVLVAGLLVFSIALLSTIRPPRVDVPIEIRVERQVRVEIERLRGRSRRPKDLSSSL